MVTRATRGLIIELTCEPEHESIEGNCSAIDPETDAETARWIREQLAAGNEWAWCMVHVRVTYMVGAAEEFHMADSYLGCCSYGSKAEFKADPYFNDMVDECIARINAQLSEV